MQNRAYDPRKDATLDPMKMITPDFVKMVLGEHLRQEKAPVMVDKRIHFYAVSTTTFCQCPACGQEAASLRTYSTRNPQMVPFYGHPMVLHARLRRYLCTNPECAVNTFVEPSDIMSPYKQVTDMATQLILIIAIFCNDHVTADVCNLIGLQISHDKVHDVVESIVIDDDPNVEAVGIDDVANRKGQDYHTAIYDAKDHHLLALLDGRDGVELKKWLEEHKNIKIVARDRASAFAKAITDVLPYCIQVADRFHIFQNLMGRLKDVLRDNQFPEHLYVVNGQLTTVEPPKIYTQKPVPQDVLGKLNDYDNSAIVDKDGNEVRVNGKTMERSARKEAESAAARQKKYDLVNAIRREYNGPEKPTQAALADKYNVCPATVSKYLGMTDKAVENLRNIQRRERHSIVEDYDNMIYRMLGDHIKPYIIAAYVKEKGYTGTSSALNLRIKNIALNEFGKKVNLDGLVDVHYEGDVQVISRGAVLKYITIKDKEKMKDSAVAQYFDQITALYPVAGRVKEIWDDFYPILMGNDPDLLDPFLAKYEESEIAGFVTGIRLDEEAVKNAIRYDLNSGFVEGENNQEKTVKRGMYGRAGTEYLEKKVYAVSYYHSTGELPMIAE